MSLRGRNPIIRIFNFFMLEVVLVALIGYAICNFQARRTAPEGPFDPPNRIVEKLPEEKSEPVVSTALVDQDHDGMPDEWEIANYHNPQDPEDALIDFDADGLTALEEYLHGTNPLGSWEHLTFPVPPSLQSKDAIYASAINSSCQFLVNTDDYDSSGNQIGRPFLVDAKNGNWIPVGPAESEGGYFFAWDLNNAGTTAMEVWSPDWSEGGGRLRFADGSTEDPTDADGNPTIPYRLNNFDEWIGYSLPEYLPVRSDGSALSPEDAEWLNWSPNDINDAGVVLGTATDPFSGWWISCLDYGDWFFSTGQPGDYPGFNETSMKWENPAAINRWGGFAGIAYQAPSYVQRTFYFDGTYHEPTVNGQKLDGSPIGVDDHGRVLSYYWDHTLNYLTTGTLSCGNVAVPLTKLAAGVGLGTMTIGGINSEGAFVVSDSSTKIVHLVRPNQDADGDGMSDDWEDVYGLNKNSAADANLDPDGDGTSNLGEFRLRSNPNLAPAYDAEGDEIDLRPGIDTDGDGIPNVWEWQNGLDYQDPEDAPLDSDRDGYSNLQEFRLGTDPRGNPQFKVREVGSVPDTSSGTFTKIKLGSGVTSGTGSTLIGSNVVEEVFFYAQPANATLQGGARPAVWRIGRTSEDGAGQLFPSHGTASSATILTQAPNGSHVASQSGASPMKLIYWASPNATPISFSGEVSATNTRSLSACSLSPSGSYLAAWRTVHSTGVVEPVIWKMEQGKTPIALPLPSTPTGITLATGTTLWVNDFGFVTATARQAAKDMALVWSLNQQGTAATPVILQPLIPAGSTTVAGISNSSEPIIAGTAVFEGVNPSATVWDKFGTALNIGVGSGVSSSVTAIASNGLVAGVSKVVEGSAWKSKTFIARNHSEPGETADWRLNFQGDSADIITHQAITEAGEILGTCGASSSSQVPMLWRGGRGFALDRALSPASGFALQSIDQISARGTLLATAWKDGYSTKILLIPDNDTDGDGLPDPYERENGFDPLVAHASGTDVDGDGLGDKEEFQNGTNPRLSDSDNDGMSDGWEFQWGLNPLDPTDAHLDPDGDYVTNLREQKIGTCPTGVFRAETVAIGQANLSKVGDNGAFITGEPFSEGENYWGTSYNLYPASNGTLPRQPSSLGEEYYYIITYDDPEDPWYESYYWSPTWAIDESGHVHAHFVDETNTWDELGNSSYSTVVNWLASNVEDPAPIWNTFDEIGVALSKQLAPYVQASAPSGRTWLLREEQMNVGLFVDSSGSLKGTHQTPDWTFVNSGGQALKVSQRSVAANNGVAAHNELDILFWNGESVSTIPTPPEWYPAPLLPTVQAFSDDGKAIVQRAVRQYDGGNRYERYLLDLASGEFSLIATPDFGNESIAWLSPRSGKMVGTGLKPFVVLSDGTSVLLGALRIKTSPEGTLSAVSSQYARPLVPFCVSSKGIVTIQTSSSSNDNVVLQLIPDNDANGNGIPDDYETEIRAALAEAGRPIPSGTPISGDMDYDGDGYTLSQEMGLGTSDSGTSKPVTLSGDSDHDSVPDARDADPFDSVIDWEKGPRPEFVVKTISGASWNSATETSEPRFIDMDDNGRVLFQSNGIAGAFKISPSPNTPPDTLEVHNVTNPGSISSPGELVEYCDPYGLAGNTGDVFGRAWFHGEPVYPEDIDPNDPDDDEAREQFLRDVEALRPYGIARWKSTVGNALWQHEEHTPDTFGFASFSSPSGKFGSYRPEVVSGGDVVEKSKVTFDGKDLPSPREQFPAISFLSSQTMEAYCNKVVSFIDSGEMAAEVNVSTGDSLNSGGTFGVAIWNVGAPEPQCEEFYEGEYMPGPNCYRKLAIPHQTGTEERRLLFTSLGLRVGRMAGEMDLSNLSLFGVKGISKQGWILFGNALWVNGERYSLDSFLEDDGFTVLAAHGITESGAICATVQRGEDWTDVSLALLVPFETDTNTSTSSLPGNIAPMAPPEYRKVALNGRSVRESKPQNEAEIDLADERTHIDAFTRMLRHDTSHVFVPVPASDLALQVTMNLDNSPVEIPSSAITNPEEQLEAGMDLAAHAKKVRDRIESDVSHKIGAFGLGWSSNLDCHVKLQPTFQKLKPEEGAAAEMKFAGYQVELVDESGAVHEFISHDLQNFTPKPSLVPNAGDLENSLSRKLVNGVERLVLQKKYGSTIEYAWSGGTPPASVDRDGDEIEYGSYSAQPVAVSDKYGNRILWSAGGGSMFVDGRQSLNVQVNRSSLSGGGDHRKFSLVTSVVDPRGSVTRFSYSWISAMGAKLPVLAGVTKADGSTSGYVFSSRVGQPVDRGEEVARLDPAQANASVFYELTDSAAKKKYEIDLDDERLLSVYLHVNLTRVINPDGTSYQFTYKPTEGQDLVKVHFGVEVDDPTGLLDPGDVALKKASIEAELRAQIISDFAEKGAMEVAAGVYAFPAMGGPDEVTGVTLPDGTAMGIAVEENHGNPPGGNPAGVLVESSFPLAGSTKKPNVTKVTDASGHMTKYTFGGLRTVMPTPPAGAEAGFGRYQGDENQALVAESITYTALTIEREGKSATYQFDPAASMALSGTIDHNGNAVAYEHGQVIGQLSGPLSQMQVMDGPPEEPVVAIQYSPNVTAETRWDGAVAITKHYSYDADSNLMTSCIDARGNETVTTVVNGKRTSEKVYLGVATAEKLLTQTDYEYGSLVFPGFVTKKTVKKVTRPWDTTWVPDPSWVGDLITQYIQDSMGRVALSRVVHPTDSGQNLDTWMAYDAAGNKTRERDPKGNWTDFTYDAVGRLIEVHYPGATAPVKTFGYDRSGRKIRETDEIGNSTLWRFDAMGRVTATARDMNNNQAIDGPDLITYTHYDSLGNPLSVTDPNGGTAYTSYDQWNRPTSITDAAGGATLFDYSGPNSGSGLLNGPGYKPTRTRDPRGYVTVHSCDSLYRPTGERREIEITSGNWWERVPDDTHWTKSETSYDKNGNVTEARTWRTGASAPIVSVTEYDPLNRAVKVTAAQGTGLSYDTLTRYTTTGLAWESVAYAGHSALERHSETEYDFAGRPIKVWSPHPDTGAVERTAPSGGTASALTQTGYDRNGNVLYVIDPRNQQTDFEYDERNRKTVTLSPAAVDYSMASPASVRASTSTQYDKAGNITSMTGVRGDVTSNLYDPANRLTSSTVAQGTGIAATTETTYDKNGNVVAVKDANGNYTRNQYDKLNRLVATAVNPATGQPSPDFANGTSDIVVVNVYDAGGNLIKVADGMAAKSCSSGAWSITESAGHVTGFTYDGLGRKLTQTWDVGSSVNKTSLWEYDALVQTASKDAKEQRTEFQYDELLRPLFEIPIGRNSDHRKYSYAGDSPVVPGTTTYSSYISGPGPMVACWSDMTGLIAYKRTQETYYTHDRLDRVTSETSASETHQYRYDIAGNRTLVTYGRTGRSLVSKFDALGRVETIIDTMNSVSNPDTYVAGAGDLVTSYRYDKTGAIVGKTLPNGTVTTNSYDLRGRLLATSTRAAGGAMVSQSEYGWEDPVTHSRIDGYDAMGNVLRVKETYKAVGGLPSREVSNTYDRTYRLLSETDRTVSTGHEKATSYEYDAANNRTRKGTTETGAAATFNRYVFGTPALNYNTNQLVGIGKDGIEPVPGVVTDLKLWYYYDANGNRTSRWTSPGTAAAAADTYTYDYRCRLIQLSIGTSTVPGGNMTHLYRYDHRTRRTTNQSGSNVARLSFSGGQSVQEYNTNLLGSLPVLETIRGSDMGGGVGGVLYTNNGGSSAAYNHYNSRGDVVSQTNNGGGVEWEAAYEAFGTRTVEDGVAVGRQRANTKDEDVTGLLNEGMRYRDLEAGVFITRDPAGFVDGPNVYTYVRQNPWSSFDALGLYTVGGVPEKPAEAEELQQEIDETDKKIDKLNRSLEELRSLEEPLLPDAYDIIRDRIGFLSAELDRMQARQLVYENSNAHGFLLGPRVRKKCDQLLVDSGFLSQKLFDIAYFNTPDNPALQDPTLDFIALYDGAALVGGLGRLGLEMAAAKGAANTAGRTNAQLVQDIATRAEAWGARQGIPAAGSGPVQGTLKHGYAERLLDRYQSLYGSRGLQTEASYLNGQAVPYGTKGSVRLDVHEPSSGSVWDYKFTPNPSLPASRVQRIINNGPAGINSVDAVGP